MCENTRLERQGGGRGRALAHMLSLETTRVLDTVLPEAASSAISSLSSARLPCAHRYLGEVAVQPYYTLRENVDLIE